MLAVLGEKRAAVLPDVPTAAEAGYPGVVMGAWLAPKGTRNRSSPRATPQ